MKKLSLLLIILLSFQSFGQDRKIKAYLDTKQFYNPEIGNYIEIYTKFVGHSLNYVGENNGLIGEVGISLSIKKDTVTVASDAFRLKSPFMKDSIVEDFYNLNRFSLQPGDYTFSIELFDINSQQESIKSESVIIIEDLSQSVSFSDIQIGEYIAPSKEQTMFSKSGYEVYPRLSTYYPSELNTLPIYLELYNTTLIQDSTFGVKQSIINSKTGDEVAKFTSFEKYQSATIIPILKSIDISELYSGKYILRFDIIDKNLNTITSQDYEFERTNVQNIDLMNDKIIQDPAFQASITDDSLGFYLESLIPISGPAETKNIIRLSKEKDAKKTREYIQKYWMVTAPNNMYEAWIKYKTQVILVEKEYSNNFQEGFETDRGRVYLQYGPPSAITKSEFKPSEYPYEIWRYTNIGTFSNKRFVFYNPDLVNNAYRLLHSDMLGELKNPAWPQAINSRNTMRGVDDPNQNIRDSHGRSVLDDFEQN